jgi:poly-gamma-glutamate capsule biosynthesis protein CapA/YwtB (metallophosphatase superfamily)
MFLKSFIRISLTFCLQLSWLCVASQDTTRLSMLFLGDIMQHDSQISDAYDPITKKYNYAPCFQYIKPYTKSVDLAIGNFELTLAGPPYKGYPQFSAPDELLFALKDMGMDVLVTANNHCVDRGKQGLERTIMMLDSLKILHTGTFVDDVERLNLHPLLVEKKGFRLAFLNYTYGTNGLPVYPPNIVNPIEKELIRKDMVKARAMKPDAIIVFLHWGSEYQSLPSEWQKDIGKFCFDQGANIIIGAHPHVIQPMEWRKKDNRLIAYSLGNFVSGQRKRYTDGGALVRIEFEKITVKDGTSLTAVDSASYFLEWVYRTVDQEKNYYVLPVPSLTGNAINFIKDSESREAFKIFVDDSRALLGKHNIAISESDNKPEFFIEYAGVYADTVKVREVLGETDLLSIVREGDSPLIRIGPFTRPDAENLRKTLQIEGVIRKQVAGQ